MQIVPDYYEKDRIENIVSYCKKYGFKNVMLFINAEEYNVGHMTKEEAKPWIEAIKRAKAALNANGISVSLNPWIEIGHLDRKRPLKKGQDFVTMVDCNGTKSEMVVCSLDEKWRAYFADYYKYIIKETDPEVVWVEDDFRLHNHAPLYYGGCFCKLHMKKFNEKLGTKYTRKQFVERLYGKQYDEKVKRAWLDVNRECMSDTAEFLGKTVKSVGLKTKVGLMSSMHQKHAMEGRDWFAVHKGLAQGGEIINRLHLPCYDETSGKKYFYNFNLCPFILRGMIPTQAKIYPELENGSFSTFTKDARFLRFQLESSVPLCVSGMTYDIYDFVGNGTRENLGYGEEVKAITPYLNGVLKLGIGFSSLTGVILPVDEKTVYNKIPNGDINDYYPDDCEFYAYLLTAGINCKPSTDKRFTGKVVALSGGSTQNFTDDELRSLFENNYVILEGNAVKRLIDRDLGELIGAESYKYMTAEMDVQSYEQVSGDEMICGIKGYRASVFGKAGDFVNVKYYEKTTERTAVYDYLGNKVGSGLTEYKNAYMIPFVIDEMKFEQYNDLRTHYLYKFLKRTGIASVLTGYSGVCSYLYEGDGQKTLILVNSTTENFKETAFFVSGFCVNEIYYVNKKTGKKKKAEFMAIDDKITVKLPFEYLSTNTLILK